MKRAIILVLIIMLWVCSGLAAETIYNWIDKNGIQRFSDQPPPENVEHYDTIQISPDQSAHQEPAGDSRPEYDRMLENIRRETQQSEQERRQSEAARTTEEIRKTGATMKARVEAERRQLQEKIDALNKRPQSRTYNQSFKQAQIDKIQKQLDKLNNSPDEYFQNPNSP